MMMLYLSVLLSIVLVICQAQQSDVDTYYSAIDPSLQDEAMKAQLFALMNPHVVFTYDEAWVALDEIDKTLPTYPCAQNDTTKFPDVYSSYCWTNGQSMQGGECGEYKKEGDCWNREHLWPKSWFGGFDYGANAQTDLFELWSTDGYVNGMRSNWPLGEVSNTGKLYISSNGAKIGSCSSVEDNGQVGTCFEPAEMYKGPFARAYFYLSVTYMNQWTCCDTDGTSLWNIKPWMETLLRKWHHDFPVNDNERARNDLIYTSWQKNRNAFIDHPEWVDQIADF